MKKKIITNNDVIRQISQEATIEESASIIQDLKDSLEGERGIGLSAIQIGIPKRISIIKFGTNFITLINPEILEKGEKFRFSGEGCLSYPGIYLDTIRYKSITIRNKGREEYYTLETDGILTVAVQHEINHLFGITIFDRKWKKQ